jgi:DNA-binding response OmpR family regulator
MQKLLVIDDEPGVRESIRFSLSKNFDIYTTASVAEAVTVVAFQEFDLIILDLFLETDCRDGLKVLKVIRHLDPGVAVIILTAFGSLESAQEAIRLGADDYLTKPFDTKDLCQRVSRLVQVSTVRRHREIESTRSLKDVEHLLVDFRGKPEVQKQKTIEMSLMMIQAASACKKWNQGFERLKLKELLSGIVFVLTGKELEKPDEEIFIVGNKLALLKAFFRFLRDILQTGKMTVELTSTHLDAECRIVGGKFDFQPENYVLPMEIIRIHEGTAVPMANGVVIRLPLDFSGSQPN